MRRTVAVKDAAKRDWRGDSLGKGIGHEAAKEGIDDTAKCMKNGRYQHAQLMIKSGGAIEPEGVTTKRL